MKILFVQSYLGPKEPQVFPLGLSCLCAQLKDNHEVRAFDANVHEDPYAVLKKEIADFAPEVIGISLRNIDSTNKREVVFYYEGLKMLVDVIKSASLAKIIVGGSGFSMFSREIMQDEPRIDYGIFLEGEVSLPKLLEDFDRPEKAPGVLYRKNGQVLFSGGGGPVDLNRVKLPERGLLNVQKYRGISEAIGIETKRGCALKCVYCIYGFLNGRNYRFRDPEKIVDEIESLVNGHGIKRFTFVDSVFNIPPKHAQSICMEIIKRGVKVNWSAWFSEKGLTRDFVALAVEAGCDKVILSPDGFTDPVLKSLEKNITNREILSAFELLSSMDGFEVCYNFFKNPPGQTLGAFLSMAAFCVKAKRKMGKRVHFEFNSMRVEPHTKLYDIALREGFVKKDQCLLYPVYYTNPSTSYIEKAINLTLRLKGK